MHKCPVAVCPVPVDDDMLMCRTHWYMVPAPLRTAVWTAWQDGAGAGSTAHTAAIRAATRHVNDKIARGGK